VKNLKQISFIAWFEDIKDESLTHLERGWKEIVLSIDPFAKCNVLKKEKSLNVPRKEEMKKVK